MAVSFCPVAAEAPVRIEGSFTLKLLEKMATEGHRLGRPRAGKQDVSYLQTHVL